MVKAYVAKNGFVLCLRPFMSPNQKDKTLGDLPDLPNLSEEVRLQQLNRLCEGIAEI